MKFLFLFFCSFSIFAQTKGVVVDILGNQIPYVNIWVVGENVGTTSEEDGTFIINAAKDKILIFSAVGFETKRTTLNDDQRIMLKSKIFELDAVIISKIKNTKEYETTDSKNRFYLPEPQSVPWVLGRKFSSKDDFKYIKSLLFYTHSEVENGMFRARIFRIGNDGLPNEDVLPEEVVVKVKKGKQKTIVNVMIYKIKIPEEGIVVAFESLLINQNKYMQKGRMGNSKKTIESLNYSPHILYFYNNTFESYSYRVGKWARFSKDFYDKYADIKLPIPAIELILTN